MALVLSLLAIVGTYHISILHQVPAALSFFAVAFSALTGGVASALVATLIGSFGVYGLIAVTTTHHLLDPVALIQTMPFDLTSLTIAYLVQRKNRALMLLEGSERHYRSIAEAASDVVITIDSQSRILSINPAVKATFDYEPEELIGSLMYVLMPERFQSAHAAGMKSYLATGVRHIPWTGVQLVGRRKGGEEIPIEISFGSYTSAGRPLFTGFIRDLSERHHAQAVIMKNEKLAAVGRLASSIAHEINNPLEAVTNLIYLAKESQDLAKVSTYLGIADAELRRVSVIANRTLQFHRQSKTAESVHSDDLIRGALALYQGRLATANVMVEERYRARVPLVCVEGDIRQVLNNLIGNSIDALQPNGGRILLRSRDATDVKSGSKGWVLTIADTGTGMSAETQKQIFEPFFSTKGKDGSGLGLWISCQLIEQSHGNVRVRSSQVTGRSGTVFTLFLPHHL